MWFLRFIQSSFFKYLIAASLLIYLCFMLDWDMARQLLINSNWWTMLLVIVVYLGAHLLRAYRWFLLIPVNTRPSFSRVLEASCIGVISGLVLPATVGEDII